MTTTSMTTTTMERAGRVAPALTAKAVAAATPGKRERYVDFLRVLSLAIVMFGHWMMAAVTWHDGRLVAGNVLDSTPSAQWLTWLFQIMPVFFIVGGFANTASWTAAVRDGRSYGEWLGSRLARLVRPVLAFVVVWCGIVAALALAGVPGSAVRAGSIAQPLWFLAVYVVVVALAPAMVSAQARWGWGVSVALAAGVAAVDIARWGLGVPYVGGLNLALMWLFAHQLGVAWRSGAVAAWSRRRMAVFAVGGMAALLALTTWAGYSRSMVGVGDARSNTFPPSLALVALAAWQFGLVLLARPAADRWLERPRVWTAVVAANGLAMTVFLWHLTAMLAAAAATLPTRFMPQPAVGTATWWAWRPVWVALLAVTLVPLVRVFARFETGRLAPARAVSGLRAGTAALLVAAGMAVLARKGFIGPALPIGSGLLVVSWFVLRPRATAAVAA